MENKSHNLFDLGKRLKEVRTYRGYSNAEGAARFLQISRSQYTRYESNQNITFLNLFKILELWAVPPSVFFGDLPISKESFKTDVVPFTVWEFFQYLSSRKTLEIGVFVNYLSFLKFANDVAIEFGCEKEAQTISSAIKEKDQIFLFSLLKAGKLLPNTIKSPEQMIIVSSAEGPTRKVFEFPKGDLLIGPSGTGKSHYKRG